MTDTNSQVILSDAMQQMEHDGKLSEEVIRELSVRPQYEVTDVMTTKYPQLYDVLYLQLTHPNELEEPDTFNKDICLTAVISSTSVSYAVPAILEVAGDRVDISLRDERILQVANATENAKLSVIKKLGYEDLTQDQIKEKPIVEVVSGRVLYRLRVVPKVQTLSMKDKKILDEQNREFKAKELYVIADSQIEFTGGSIVKLYGKPIADPRTQRVTMLCWRIEKIGDITTYDTKKIAELQAFFKEMTVKERIAWILRNFALYSRIIKRDNLALAVFLQRFSSIKLEFDNEVIHGWIIAMLLGDSTTAKSKTEREMIRLLGGMLISAETASMAGLIAASVQDSSGQWLADLGFLPLNDMRSLAIDGFQKLQKDDSTHMDECERYGEVSLAKAGKNRFPARVRLLKIANPVTQYGGYSTRRMGDFLYACQALPTVLNDTSIQRLDVVAFACDDDVSPAEINMPFTAEPDMRLLDMAEVLKLVWSNKLQVRFTDNATRTILNKATDLTNKYGWSGAKVAGIDLKYKLARLSAACAALALSFNIGESALNVTEEHVEVMCDFLETEYTKAGFSVLKAKEESEVLDGQSAYALLADIALSAFKNNTPEHIERVYRIIDFIVDKGSFSKDQLQGKFSLADKNEMRPLIAELKNAEIIQQGKTLYATPRAVQVIRAIPEVAILATFTAQEIDTPPQQPQKELQPKQPDRVSQLTSGRHGKDGKIHTSAEETQAPGLDSPSLQEPDPSEDFGGEEL